MDYTIEEFCNKFDACKDGKEWALKNCKTMLQVYKKAKPEWVIWIATRHGVLDDETLRSFARWCALRVSDLWDAPQIVINYLKTGDNNLRAAARAAAAAGEAAAAGAMEAAWEAAGAWAGEAAMEAAGARAAAGAMEAVWAAAWAGAWAGAGEKQKKWLLKNTKPNFNKD